MKKIYLFFISIIFLIATTACQKDTPIEPTRSTIIESSVSDETDLAVESEIFVNANFSSELIVSAPEEWREPFQEIALLGENRYEDMKLTFRFADEDILVEELKNGAAVDLFIAETISKAEELQEQNLVRPPALDLGKNELILIANNDVTEKTFSSFLDPEIIGIVSYGAEGDDMSNAINSILENIRKEQNGAQDGVPEEDVALESAPPNETRENDDPTAAVEEVRQFAEGLIAPFTADIDVEDKVSPETTLADHSRLVSMGQNMSDISEDTSPPTSSVEEKQVHFETADEVILYVKENAGSVGFIYRTDLSEEEPFPEAKPVPEDWYEPKIYSIMIAEAGEQLDASAKFLELMSSQEAREIIQRYGIVMGEQIENAG